MDPIKEAFYRIKEDIILLKNEIYEIKEQINKIQTNQTQSYSQLNQQTDKPTDKSSFKTNFTHNPQSSTGNRGVPTDRQTNQQTDRQPLQKPHNLLKDPISEFARANEILNSLDDIKREIHLKFKHLTPQEMLVFSTLYGLEEQNIGGVTYRAIAEQLQLSESSIRDYINKLTNKGIPLEKIRQNNKTILLKISQDLKNIATLATIQNLREL